MPCLRVLLLMCVVSVFLIPTKVQAEDRCVSAPVLMYHHIVNKPFWKRKRTASLFVTTDVFHAQMQELRDLGYSVKPIKDLKNFFDYGAPLPKKVAFITFDDGNKNIFDNAMPILHEFGYPYTMFVVIKQMDHPLYMNIGEAKSMDTFGGLIANHTQSHQSLNSKSPMIIDSEIKMADAALQQSGLNKPKVFAYPYGNTSLYAEKVLSEQGYTLAFVATAGGELCASRRLTLPRIQVLSKPLSEQGF